MAGPVVLTGIRLTDSVETPAREVVRPTFTGWWILLHAMIVGCVDVCHGTQ